MRTTATAVRIKKRIADYFIAQLNLAAEVCLDRNYVAIELCEATLDFNDLFSILKTPELDELLYAAGEKLAASPGCESLRMLQSRIKRHDDDD